MDISEQLIKYAPYIIIVIVGLLIVLYFVDQITGGHIVKSLLCPMLFLIPYFGPLFSILTQACVSIPA